MGYIFICTSLPTGTLEISDSKRSSNFFDFARYLAAPIFLKVMMASTNAVSSCGREMFTTLRKESVIEYSDIIPMHQHDLTCNLQVGCLYQCTLTTISSSDLILFSVTSIVSIHLAELKYFSRYVLASW